MARGLWGLLLDLNREPVSGPAAQRFSFVMVVLTQRSWQLFLVWGPKESGGVMGTSFCFCF